MKYFGDSNLSPPLPPLSPLPPPLSEDMPLPLPLPPAPACALKIPDLPRGAPPRPLDRESMYNCTLKILWIRVIPRHHVLEHWRILEHVREDHESDLGPPDVDVLKLGHPAIPVGDCD